MTALERYYPETLSFVLIYNAPWVFQPFWRIITPWLDPVVSEKVRPVASPPPPPICSPPRLPRSFARVTASSAHSRAPFPAPSVRPRHRLRRPFARSLPRPPPSVHPLNCLPCPFLRIA